MAKIGGFNFVSRELGATRPYCSYYTYKESTASADQKVCMADLDRLADTPDKWVLTILAASGAGEPAYPTQFHFTYGAKKGNETFDDPNITIHDITTANTLMTDFSEVMERQFALHTDRQRYHNNAAATYFGRHLTHNPNVLALRTTWSVIGWDMRAIRIAQEIAVVLNRHIEHRETPEDAELTVKAIGYSDYTDNISKASPEKPANE